MFERYTEKARRVIFFARYEASSYGAAEITPEHLLLGLIREDKGLILPYSGPGGTPLVDYIRAEVDKNLQRRPEVPTNVDLPLSKDSRAVLTGGATEADELGHRHIGTEHLLLGLLRLQKSVAAQILHRCGIEPAKIRERADRCPMPPKITPRPYGTSLRSIGFEAVMIHGLQHPGERIRTRVAECRAYSWYWRKQQWTPRDLAVERSTGQISFDVSLLENNSDFDIAQRAWRYDLCAICQWRLEQSPEEVHSTGYTNGRDWVCVECYEKFLKRSDYFGSSYAEIT